MSRKKTEIKCDGCNNNFLKENRYIKSSLKKGRKNFCSLSCQMTHNNRSDSRFKNTKNLQRGSTKDEYSPFRYHYRKTYQRNKDCGITLEEIYDLWNKQKGKCAITGIEMTHDKKHPNTASLDRIDSNLGYIKENCQFVCFSINMAKHKFSAKEFDDFIKKLLH